MKDSQSLSQVSSFLTFCFGKQELFIPKLFYAFVVLSTFYIHKITREIMKRDNFLIIHFSLPSYSCWRYFRLIKQAKINPKSFTENRKRRSFKVDHENNHSTAFYWRMMLKKNTQREEKQLQKTEKQFEQKKAIPIFTFWGLSVSTKSA